MSVDPSSDRDSLVLHLLDMGLSNRRLARELGVAVSVARKLIRRLTARPEPLPQGPYVRPDGPRVPCASTFAVAAVLGTEGRGWGTFCEEE